MKLVPSCESCELPIENESDRIETADGIMCRSCYEAPMTEDEEKDGSGVDTEKKQIVDPDVPEHYEILEALSECQHGRAFKVKDKNLDADLILRFVTAGVARMTGGLPIETVAQLLTQLNHPHLVTVYDWRTDLKTSCLVMDSPPEKSIQTVIAKEGFFDLPRALEIYIQVCEALEELHKQRMVHGFIRPRTIRLAASDSRIENVRVMCFSIANVFNNNLEQPLKIGRNYTCNDVFYMSPEELTGALPTVSADIYSLGCVIFHSITGKPVYRARTVKEVQEQHMSIDPARFRKRYEIPTPVEQVVLHMLEKDPLKRYKSIRGVRQDLERVRDNKDPIMEDKWRQFLAYFGA